MDFGALVFAVLGTLCLVSLLLPGRPDESTDRAEQTPVHAFRPGDDLI